MKESLVTILEKSHNRLQSEVNKVFYFGRDSKKTSQLRLCLFTSPELSPNLEMRLTSRNLLFNKNFPRNSDEARLGRIFLHISEIFRIFRRFIDWQTSPSIPLASNHRFEALLKRKFKQKRMTLNFRSFSKMFLHVMIIAIQIKLTLEEVNSF